jgi:hypothetical protein
MGHPSKQKSRLLTRATSASVRNAITNNNYSLNDVTRKGLGIRGTQAVTDSATNAYANDTHKVNNLFKHNSKADLANEKTNRTDGTVDATSLHKTFDSYSNS